MAGIRVQYFNRPDSDEDLDTPLRNGCATSDEPPSAKSSQVYFCGGAMGFSNALDDDSDTSGKSEAPSTSSVLPQSSSQPFNTLSFRFGRTKRFRRATTGEPDVSIKRESSSSGVEAAVEVVDDDSIRKIVEQESKRPRRASHATLVSEEAVNLSSESGYSATTASSVITGQVSTSKEPNNLLCQNASTQHLGSRKLSNESVGRISDHLERISYDGSAQCSGPSPTNDVSLPLCCDENNSLDAMFQVINGVFRRHYRLPLRVWRYWITATLVILSAILPSFFSGLLWGLYLGVMLFLYFCVGDPSPRADFKYTMTDRVHDKIQREIDAEISAENDPNQKKIFKGWMNIINEPYRPHTFHVNSLQTVLVRLDGKFLRISRPATALFRHGFHTDPSLTETEPKMLGQSIYDLTNASVKLRPRRLARRRWFSRKYPIAIKLASTEVRSAKTESAAFEHNTVNEKTVVMETAGTTGMHSVFGLGRESDGYTSGESSDVPEKQSTLKRSMSNAKFVGQSCATQRFRHDLPATTAKPKPARTIYLFARCAREKERWFHRLRSATKKYQDGSRKRRASVSMPLHDNSAQTLNRDYFLYLLNAVQFNKHLEESLSVKPQYSAQKEDTILMDLGRKRWTQPDKSQGTDTVLVANLIASRVFYDFCRDHYWCKAVQDKIQTKLGTIHLPYFVETLELSGFDIGTAIPKIAKIYEPTVDDWGVWVDFELTYEGCIKLALETRVNLMRIKQQHDSMGNILDQQCSSLNPSVNFTIRSTPTRYSDSELPESPETSPDEEYGSKLKLSEKKEKRKSGKKLLNLVDKIASSSIFKEASELKPIRKMMEEISSTRLLLHVEVTELSGIMAINIPPPPSDRLWYAFRKPPKMSVRAVPKVGDRPVVFSALSEWIEGKIVQVLEKNLVLPNMDDIIIPVMSGNELLQGSLNK